MFYRQIVHWEYTNKYTSIIYIYNIMHMNIIIWYLNRVVLSTLIISKSVNGYTINLEINVYIVLINS